ncbi:MAG: hypothetical protein IPK81_21435 [Rhodospirillales bacterium]|nr:MAG: hypothetical protein IPK81_21435 [Rhodospirillales bacterium]
MHSRLFHASVIAGVLFAGGAMAQQSGTYTFRLAANPANVGVCNALDAALSREHTVTVAADKAAIKSSGGITDDMKATGAGVYRTEFELGRVRLVVVADTSKTPRTLLVTEPREGCKWSGTTP